MITNMIIGPCVGSITQGALLNPINYYLIDVDNVTSSNAASPLTTPTYDESGQAVHPDVYYNADSWNGWIYWMVMTPYPFSGATYENPSILVSNNGDDWEVPAGLTNPLVAAPGGSGTNADPDIFLGYDNKLYIIFLVLESDGETRRFKVMSSDDGINWSEPVTAIDFGSAQNVSPAVVKTNGNYTLWYNDNSDGNRVLKKRTASTPTGPWSVPVTCNFEGLGSRYLWHLDVVKYGSEYHMLINSTSTNLGLSNLKLTFAISKDGINWIVNDNAIIDVSEDGWDSLSTYRGTLVLKNNGTTDYYDCFYSGRNDSNVWRIARTVINIPANAGLFPVEIVNTFSVKNITDSSAVVEGTIYNVNEETTWSIEYGLTPGYGLTASGGVITKQTKISKELTELMPYAAYFWRIKAVNTEGTFYSSGQTFETINSEFAFPLSFGVAGLTSGTPTAGTIVLTAETDINITSTGDAVISVARADEGDLRKHTITVNCANNGSGTIEIPVGAAIRSLGNYNGNLAPSIDFYSGSNTTAPRLTVDLSELPNKIEKIRQLTYFSAALIGIGTRAWFSKMKYITIRGGLMNWTLTGNLPYSLELVYLSLAPVVVNHSGNWPPALNYIYLNSDTITLDSEDVIPNAVNYILMNGANLNWTALNVNDETNILTFDLSNFRSTKLTSAEMVTFLTNLTNRTGTLPATITINDYADALAPPQSVTDAVAALKLAKSITTVNLGA